MTPLYLVDASIYIFRSYYSIPPNFHAANGELINAVYGYTQFLLDLIDREPEYISVAFDESLVSCYRNEIYPDYKANRDLPDANLEYQLARCQEITGLLGFHHLCLKYYEADDIIGTLLTRFGEGHEAIIVTRDKDLGQLLREGDRLWDFASDTYSSRTDVFDKFGVHPEQLPDFLALAGDAVDNIPGAPGIGAKTAAALLAEFGTLEALLENSSAVAEMKIRGAKRLCDVLKVNEERLRMFRQITDIHREVPMELTKEDLRLSPKSSDAVLTFCDEMQFGRRIRDRIERSLKRKGE
jgi:5'-3' exonuclease